ncbi:inosine/xanthosine triphosphatase [Salegentibacter sp. JZCK2]|nr:inosine/xanthosine triphosphatase [Salegentibacter tibetensis]MBZ9729051.1 inosine/xanthosine triphosphatase [Salegentibacter tibetensis]
MDKKVIIASKNPVKLKAVKEGFTKMFQEETFNFKGISVPSGVQDQPMEDDTTLRGALNRANNAMAKVQNADYWVGIEGGIEKTGEKEMQAFAWIVVKSRQYIGKGKTGTFFLPDEIISLINEGKELGEADDIVFGQNNSKQKNGAVGILTGNVIDRADLYSQGVILALIPFKHTSYYS